MKSSIQQLQKIIEVVPQKVIAFSNKKWATKSLPNQWSKKETLGHLCDSALYNWKRFSRALSSEQPYQAEAYPQEELVYNNQYQQQPISQILQLWQSLNRQILLVGKNITEENKNLEIILSNGNRQTLGKLFRDYIRHLEFHLKEIFPDWDLEKMPLPSDAKWQWSTFHSMQQLTTVPDGKKFATLYRRGKMYVEIYAPEKVDLQQPHEQDELYVVISGSGTFFNDGERHPFQAGDLLFVPAGVEHRFEDFSDDFKTWVIFYGPMGGEKKHLESSHNIAGKVYTISTDDELLDVNVIYNYLTHSYWATGRTLETVQQSLEYSLNFGLYFENQQIGLARVITDYTTFAYLADVFILKEYRGNGLGKWLLKTIMEWGKLQPTKGWVLKTRDAHGLYKKYGFQEIAEADIFMEKPKEV